MNRTDNERAVAEYLGKQNSNTIVEWWRDYCYNTNGYDDDVFDMDEFDELMNAKGAWEATRAAFFGDFNPTHNWFRFNAYGNLESFDYWDDSNSPIDLDEIASWICGNPEVASHEAWYGGDSELSAMLEESEDEENE